MWRTRRPPQSSRRPGAKSAQPCIDRGVFARTLSYLSPLLPTDRSMPAMATPCEKSFDLL